MKRTAPPGLLLLLLGIGCAAPRTSRDRPLVFDFAKGNGSSHRTESTEVHGTPSLPVLVVTPPAIVLHVDVGDHPLGGWQAVLRFDPSVVVIDRITGTDATGFQSPPHADPTSFESGEVRLLGYALGPDAPRGDVPVARVHFRPVSAGLIDLTITTEAVADPDARALEAWVRTSARTLAVEPR